MSAGIMGAVGKQCYEGIKAGRCVKSRHDNGLR